MKKIKKILIANRGEIALRVMRTCHEQAIQTVAVYSQPDRKALHTRYAREAYALESYLDIEKIISIAKKSGAEAVHPGYGFLSENSDFAQAVLDAKLVFIGPKPKSIYAMGSKTRARQLMQEAGVPVIPGLTQSIENAVQALRMAQEMGFPVMLKAAAGGGGRGMRKVEQADSFLSAFESAQSEAKNAFGDASVYIEKFLEKPRHIEVQIFADQQGHVMAFPERECSVQRRHQKVIEESPSCFVDPKMRYQMGEISRQAAQAVDYIGAGTIEFLVDAHKNFYFMEMNTRLQVEHPITEMVTGLDLVDMQIRVAQEESLSMYKTHLGATGWSMEARICAEDPEQNFIPMPGWIRDFKSPSGPYVRMDAAIENGTEISSYYDSMIAKVIVWAQDRERAIRRLDRALSELIIRGCTTNTAFVRKLLSDDSFVAGDYDTHIIEQFKKKPVGAISKAEAQIALIAGALFYAQNNQSNVDIDRNNSQLSAWQLQQ